MIITAIIPARGGSKGIPKKNIVDVGGKPLICWTIEAALKSKVSNVIVSTDNRQIADVVTRYKDVRIIDQPAPMKDGGVNSVNVALWYLRTLVDLNMELPHGICMLLPTSPLRTAKHINGAIDKFAKGNKVVVSVCASKPLHSIRKVQDGYLMPITNGDLNKQCKDVEQLYQVNGSIYIAQPDLLLKFGSFHIPTAVPFKMGARFSIDIDTEEDLELVRSMI